MIKTTVDYVEQAPKESLSDYFERVQELLAEIENAGINDPIKGTSTFMSKDGIVTVVTYMKVDYTAEDQAQKKRDKLVLEDQERRAEIAKKNGNNGRKILS